MVTTDPHQPYCIHVAKVKTYESSMTILTKQHNNPASNDSDDLSTFYVKLDTLISKTHDGHHNILHVKRDHHIQSNQSVCPEEKACTQCVCRLTSVPWASLARTSVAIHTEHHPPSAPFTQTSASARTNATVWRPVLHASYHPTPWINHGVQIWKLGSCFAQSAHTHTHTHTKTT